MDALATSQHLCVAEEGIEMDCVGDALVWQIRLLIKDVVLDSI